MLPIYCRPKISDEAILFELVRCSLRLVVFNNKGLKGSEGALINNHLSRKNIENRMLSEDIPNRPNVN